LIDCLAVVVDDSVQCMRCVFMACRHE